MVTAEQVRAALQRLAALDDYGDYCAYDHHLSDEPMHVGFTADDPYNGCNICAQTLADELNKELSA